MTLAFEAYAQNLTPEEEAKVGELSAAVAASARASPAAAAFCTRGTYVRYLRARSWNVHKAARMLEDTLAWRAAFRPDAITWGEMKEEASRGKVYVLDEPDRDGRPVVFMRPRKETSVGDNDTRVRWVVYVMETASRVADERSPDGKMTWLIDFVGYNRKNQPPMKVSMQTLSIVQAHYPERLGRAVNFQPPLLFEIFYKAIRPFVDPVTREKLVFLHAGAEGEAGMARHFSLEHLDAGVCGALPEDGMWDLEAYEEKMKRQDEEHAARLAAAAARLAAAPANE